MTNKFFNVRQRSNELFTTTTEKVRNLIGSRTGVARYVTLLLLVFFGLGVSQSAWAEKGFYSDGQWNAGFWNGAEIWGPSSGGYGDAKSFDLGVQTTLYLKNSWVKTWSDGGWTQSKVTWYYWIEGKTASSANATKSSVQGNQTWNFSCDYNLISNAPNNPGQNTLKMNWNLDSYVTSGTSSVTYTIPGFTKTSTSKDYGNVAINSETSSTISFGTHYGTALTTSNCSITGDGASSYAVTAISESGVTVKFNPTSAGSKPATLTITDAHSKTCTISLSGTVPTYTITLSKNGGVEDGTASVTYGNTEVTSITKVTRTGYNCSGYYTATTGGTKVLGASGAYAKSDITGYITGGKWSKADNCTLYAQWTPKTTTITVNPNDGSSATYTKSATYDADAPTWTADSRSGYTIKGYYSEATSGSRLTAIDKDGNSYFTHTSWVDSNGKWIKASSTVSIFAQWATNYTIKLYPNGGSGSTLQFTGANAPYNVTAALQKVTPPTRNGYNFRGYSYNSNPTLESPKIIDENGNWLVVSGYTTQVDSKIYWTKDANRSCYAIWELIAPSNPSISGEAGYKPGDNISLTASATGAELTYQWYKNDVIIDGATSATYTKESCVTGDAGTYKCVITNGAGSVNATKVVKVDANVYTITIAKNNDSYGQVSQSTVSGVPEGTVVTFGATGNLVVTDVATVTATPTTPSAQYTYAFEGWESDDYTTGGTVTKDGTITANFSRTLNTYTITFNPNDGVGSMDAQTDVSYGVSTQLNTMSGLSRTGYTFAGWATSASGSVVYADGANITITGNTELFAKWNPITYTVAFDGNGGSGTAPASINGTYDQALTALPANPFTKTGYDFGGWNTKQDGSGDNYAVGATPMNLTTTSGAIVTLYAKWTIHNYTISWPSASTGWSYGAGERPATAHYGDNIQFIVRPDTGYSVTVSPQPLISKSNDSIYSFTMPANDVTVSVSATENKYYVTLNCDIPDGATLRYDDADQKWGDSVYVGVATKKNITITLKPGYKFNGSFTTTGGARAVGNSGSYTISANGAEGTVTAKLAEDLRSTWYVKGDHHGTVFPEGWEATANSMMMHTAPNSKSLTWSMTVESADISYVSEFKIFQKGSTDKWWGYGGNGSAVVWDVKENDNKHSMHSNNAANMKLHLTVAGTYTFTIADTTAQYPELTVTYPTSYKVNFGVGDGGSSVTAKIDNTTPISTGDLVLSGSSVTFHYTAESGYRFTGWYTAASGGNLLSSTDADYVTTISAVTNVYAQFEEIKHTVTVSAGANGSIDPAAGDYQIGVKGQTFTPNPATGYYHKDWTTTGGASVSNNKITANDKGTATANFHERFVIRGSINESGNPLGGMGGWSGNDSTVVTNIDGNVGTYTANLTEGNKQYKFKLYDLSTSTSYGQTGTSEMQDGVQRTLNGTNDVLFTTTVPGIYTFTVDFSTIAQSKVTITYPVSHVVTFGVGDGTSGNVTATVDAAEINSGDRVLAGKTVTFTAPTAATYYKWKEWNTKADGSGDPLGTNNTLDIVLSKDTAVYATYQPITYTITANHGDHGIVSPSGSVEVNNVNYTTIEAVANGGYTFDHWEVSNVTLEGANTVNPARVKASASGGSITAMYRAAKVVYFKDVLGWGGGYCYLFSASPWDNTYGVQPKVNKIVSGAMTLVDGTTDVYKYEFDATYSPAFIAFSKDDKTEASHFNNTQASYRGDLNIEYPMFVPATTKNETKQGTDYYSSGTWFKFATNKGYKVNFGGEDVDFVFESAGSLTASVTAPSWTSYTDYQVTIKDVRTSSTTNYGKTDATLTYLASGPQTLVSNSDYITVSALSAGDYTLTLSFEAATTTPQLTVTYPQAYTITYGVGNGGATAQAKRVVNGDTTDVASGEYVAPGTTMFINQTPAVGCTFVKWNTRKNGTGTDLSNTPQLDFTMPAAAYVAYPLYSGALETSWCLVGTFNTTAWQEDGFMHQSSVGSSEVVYDDIELAAGREYEFKVKDKSTDPSTYYGNTGTITQAHCSDWTMNSSENCKIATTIAGTYQFAFNTKTKKLSVIYPDNATRAELYSSPVRDENTDIMIQAYYWAHVGNTSEEWTQYGDVKWGNMVSSHEADTLAKYFNLVWLAPSQQTKDYTGFLPQNYSRQGGATAGASEGFPWGSSQELRTYIDVLHQGGAKVVADVVINHSTPTTGWCTWDDAFDFGRYGSYEPDLTWITNQDEVWSSSESGNNCKDYAHSGNYDDEWKYSYRSNDDAVWGTQDWTYTEYNCAYSRDWAHKKADVREMTRAYLTWLRDSIGYDGFRFDFAKGLHGSRIQDYVRASAPYFAVSEVFDRDMQKQKGFLHDVGDQSYVFNFPGKCYHINAAIGGGSAGNYNLPALKNNHQTMIYGYQKWTVNFVENHDTFRETGNGDKNICDTENSMCDERRILQANAYILAMPGVPCIFYPHFHEYPNQIKAMIKARRAAGVHSQSAVTDWAGSGGSGNNWYEAQVKGSKGYVYIKLGVDCSPTYAPTDRGYGAGKAPDGKAYVCAYQGTHVSVWYTTNEETTNEKYRLLVTSDGETFYSNEVEEVGDTLSYYATEDATYQWQKYTMYEWRNCSGIAPQNIDTDYVFISTLALDGTTPSVENEGLYQGDYYIRTDEIEGGWSSYKDSKHLFTYFENVSVATGDPYHYYWVENIGKNKKVNVRATVANRFNKNLTNIIGSDKFTDSDGNVTGDNNGINIRFSYEPTTNKLGRAMILGASNNRFLNVVGDNIYKEKACTTALNEANYTSTPVDSKLGDISNWVYERTVFVKIDAGHPSSNVVIKSVFNDITQYMLGFQKDFYGNETDEPIQYPVLDAGTTSSGSSAYCIRVIYDFKTNRLVGAWEPVDQVIDKSWNIDADVLFKRFENGNTAQITFANDGDTISSLKNVLFIMEFHRDTLPKQENLYWFSLPYDCHINSIYGVEGYVTLNGNGLPTQGTWGIQRYDGETRAKTGWFKEDTQTFWKWMGKDEVLKAGEGYILDFDKSVAKFSEIDVEEQCDTCASGTRKVKKAILRLYFPSDKPGFSMTKSGAVDSVVYTDHTCNIKNRKAQDSNWRLMSPGNYSNTTIANEKDIRYDEKDSVLTAIPAFIYRYDRSQEAGSRYTAVSALSGFTYKSFNCYMAQFSGAVKWAQFTKADPASVAARQYYAPDEIRLANLKLVMENSYGEQQDHTFIKLKKGATTGYDANADLTKIVNSGIGQVYSVSEDVDYAANVLPVESQTVALKVVAAKAGSYTFSMPDGTDGVTATLVDTQTGSRTDLSLWNYTVELGKDTYAGRFYLDINIHQTPTNVVVTEGDSENEGDKMMKFIENGQLYILKNGVIYDATGKIVK